MSATTAIAATSAASIAATPLGATVDVGDRKTIRKLRRLVNTTGRLVVVDGEGPEAIRAPEAGDLSGKAVIDLRGTR